MRTVGPITLALNVGTTEVDPAEGNPPPSAAVQVQNSSPFVVNVLAAGDPYTIQPRIAQTIPVSGGQPIVITPVQQLAGGSPTVTIVWLLAGESPPMADGPLPSPSTVLPITGNVDELFSFSTVDFGVGQNINIGAALNPYETLMVVLTQGPVTTPLSPAIRIRNGQPGMQFMGASMAQTQQYVPAFGLPLAQTGPIFYIPVSIPLFDNILMDCADASTNTPGTSVWSGTVYGLGQAYCPYPLRADGRLMPVGAFSATSQSGGGADWANGFPTVPTNSRLLLKSVTLMPQANFPTVAFWAGVWANSIDGNSTWLASLSQPGGTGPIFNQQISGEGLLLDPDGSLFFQGSDVDNQLQAIAAYDLVF